MAETHHVAASAIERLSIMPPAIWIVSGLPGPLRSDVAHALLDAFERAAHVDGDGLAGAITGGRVLPGDEPRPESERQIELAIRNQCLLARSYAEAGFTPVIEYAVLTRSQLDAYRSYLAGGQIRLVVAANDDAASEHTLLLRSELAEIGVWTSDADASAILEAERSASVS